MSKIGKKPVLIPVGIEATIKDKTLNVKGKNGELSLKIMPFVRVELNDGKIIFSPENNSKTARTNWGTMRSLVQNAIIGSEKSFSKTLEIEGIGYKAGMEGNNLVLSVGLSHPVKIFPPEGIKISVEKNAIKIAGADKALVGKIAAEIRNAKKPEPYKGKGIKYQGETIRRKEGKKAAGTTA